MKAHDFVNEVGFIITNLKDIDEDIMLDVKFGDKMDKKRYDTKMPAVLNCLYAIKKMLEMEPTMRIPTLITKESLPDRIANAPVIFKTEKYTIKKFTRCGIWIENSEGEGLEMLKTDYDIFFEIWMDKMFKKWRENETTIQEKIEREKK